MRKSNLNTSIFCRSLVVDSTITPCFQPQSIDFTSLKLLVEELQQTIVPSKLISITQDDPNSLFLTLKTMQSDPFHLRLCWHAKSSWLAPTVPKIKLKCKSIFGKALESHLEGMVLTKLYIPDTNRMVCLEFTEKQDSTPTFSLYLEILGAHANLILVERHSNTVISCANQVTTEAGKVSPDRSLLSRRIIQPGRPYELPPAPHTDASSHSSPPISSSPIFSLPPSFLSLSTASTTTTIAANAHKLILDLSPMMSPSVATELIAALTLDNGNDSCATSAPLVADSNERFINNVYLLYKEWESLLLGRKGHVEDTRLESMAGGEVAARPSPLSPREAPTSSACDLVRVSPKCFYANRNGRSWYSYTLLSFRAPNYSQHPSSFSSSSPSSATDSQYTTRPLLRFLQEYYDYSFHRWQFSELRRVCDKLSGVIEKRALRSVTQFEKLLSEAS